MAGNWWDWDYNVHGGQGLDDGGGFGSIDLDEMQKAGRTKAQIRILANLAPSQGVKVYKPVQDWVRDNTKKPDWQYGAHGGPDFGLKDIEEAEKMGGVDYNKIKGYADYATETGIGVSPNAQAWLSNHNPANPRGQTDHNWMNYNFNEVGGPGMGVKDIDDMRRKGYSNAQIRILANTASKRNVDVWGGASDWVKENTEQGPWMYGAFGAENFGEADVYEARAQGKSLDDIRGYAKFAREQGIGVGSGAFNLIQDMQNKQDLEAFNESSLALQEDFNTKTLNIQQQAADELRAHNAAQMAAQAERDAKARRVTSSASTGVGGAASIRGSRLSITQPGGRSGTRRFSRQGGAQYLNPLGMNQNASSTGKSTITL